MTLRDSVDLTVDALALSDVETAVSSALVDLARRYAVEIDGAAAAASRANTLVERVLDEHGTDSALYEQVQALAAKLSARDTLDRLGTRLHAALVDLQATPKVRGVKVAPSAPAGGPSKLQSLRGGRAS